MQSVARGRARRRHLRLPLEADVPQRQVLQRAQRLQAVALEHHEAAAVVGGALYVQQQQRRERLQVPLLHYHLTAPGGLHDGQCLQKNTKRVNYLSDQKTEFKLKILKYLQYICLIKVWGIILIIFTVLFLFFIFYFFVT